MSGSVTVRVTIERVEAVTDFETGGWADFYPVVNFQPGFTCTPVEPATVDNDKDDNGVLINPGGCRAPAIIDEDEIPIPDSSIPPWQFKTTVNYGEAPRVPSRSRSSMRTGTGA